MRISRFPDRKIWPELLKRPTLDTSSLLNNVKSVLDAVKLDGDAALRKFTARFDKVEVSDFKVSQQEIDAAFTQIDSELFDAIRTAADNITTFHRSQLQTVDRVETMPGVVCWRKSVGIDTVGLYIPGGTAPLFSTVLMLGIPAILAGCRQIVLCTPPLSDGRVHPAILASAAYIGITDIFRIGGVQAIAAMAYGTQSVPRVHKIFGPGNQYVTTAKQLVQQHGVSIDMPAGPSEVAVFADSTANPEFVAADLLSQAEHGADSQVLLVTDNEEILAAVQAEIKQQLQLLTRKTFANAALENSCAIVVKNAAEAMDILNQYAPEHLILSCANAGVLAESVINAGSVFLGHYSPESAGDYATGTNHTLPTNGYAHAYSGVSVDSFVKKITFQELTREGLENVGSTVVAMATAEGLDAHAAAVRIRLGNLPGKK